MKNMKLLVFLLIFTIFIIPEVQSQGCQPDCAPNIVLNPSFYDDTNQWTPYGSGDISVQTQGQEKVLSIVNTDGSNIGVWQDYYPPESIRQPLFFEYMVKPITMGDGALVAMDMAVTYDDGTTRFMIGSLQAQPGDIGKWVKKENMHYPEKPVTKIRTILLNYYNQSSALYDNISVKLLNETETMDINNGFVTMKLSGWGYVNSIDYQGEEVLSQMNPLSRIYTDETNYLQSNRIYPEGNNVFGIRYLNSDFEIRLKITPRQGYFVFDVIETINPSSEDIYKIEFLTVYPEHVIQFETDWAQNAPDTELFFESLPMNPETVCRLVSIQYLCKVYKRFGLNGSAALIAAPKSQYFNTITRMINEYTLHDKMVYDEKWISDNEIYRDSYIFARVTQGNYQDILNYVKRGGFGYILLIGPHLFGHFNQPYPGTFQSIEDFYSAMDEFLEDGIKVGIHSQFGRISIDDPYFQDLQKNAYKRKIGNLQNTISAADTEIQIDNIFSTNSTFLYFYKQSHEFLIDNEIIRCDSYSGDTLSSCFRAQKYTQATGHSQNVPVYILARSTNNLNFLNSKNWSLIEESASFFGEVARRVNTTYLYFDGMTYYGSNEMERDEICLMTFKIKYAYIQEAGIDIPLAQLSGGCDHDFSWYYTSKHATDDGVVFKNKEFTKNYKLDLILTNNPYSSRSNFYEMGWWKIHGSSLSDGRYDFDATSPDDTQYAMLKVLAGETSMGLQLSSFYEDHQKIGSLLNIIGLYHRLIKEDIRNDLVPDHIKDYLKEPDKEAEVNNISGYNLVEKVADRQYASWSSSNPYTYSINNPFNNQKPIIEIRPRFDYYSFGDSRHTTITDFSSASTFPVETDSDITCTIQNGGTLSIVNSGSSIGMCRISIPGTFSLLRKRGLGLSIDGDGGGEMVIVRLNPPSLFPDTQSRDFKFYADFSGRRDLILGDPTTDQYDYLGSEYVYQRAKVRSWNYNYNNNQVSIYIYTLPGTYSLKLNSLKGLQEKGQSQLVNPIVRINTQIITFPVTLSMSEGGPYLLEYNGHTGNYNLYNQNYGLLSQGSVQTDASLNSGTNSIEVSSDTSNTEYSTRAEVRLSAYDDEDNDRIPTDGSYSVSYLPCGLNSDFCDDNCPQDYNPGQEDSNYNGIGDACEVTVCNTPADEDCDGCVDMDEATIYIDMWFASETQVSMVQLVRALEAWKEPCN
jgi:hypothetical protein